MKREVRRDFFEKMYLNNTNKYCANHFGVSVQTIISWAKKFDLSKGNSNKFKLVG